MNAFDHQPNIPVKPQPAEPGNLKRYLLAVSILLALMLAGAGFILIRRSSAAQTHPASTTEALYRDLETSYAAASAELDSLRRIQPELEHQIAQLQEELRLKKENIEQDVQSGGDLSAARAQIARLTRENRTAMEQIAQLKGQVKEYARSLETVNRERDSALRQVDVQQEKLDQIESERRKQSEAVVREQEKRKTEAFLGVSGVSATPLQVSRHNPSKSKDTRSARNTDQLRVCFNIEPAEWIEAGKQVFRIQVIDPGGTTMPGPGSGAEQDFQYTASAEVEYDKTPGQQVCARLEMSGFSQGDYTVNIYHRGRKAGSTVLHLKK